MTPNQTAMQRKRALNDANAKRIRIAEIRTQLRAGDLSLGDIMADPPHALACMPLIDVVRLAYTTAAPGVCATLGRRALRDRVNLLVSLGDASARSRGWVAEHGLMGCRRPAPTALRTARLEAQMTQAQLAARVGRSQKTVWRWERGERPTPPDVLALLSGLAAR